VTKMDNWMTILKQMKMEALIRVKKELDSSLLTSNVRPLTESDSTRCCTYTIEPEDEHNNARNM